MGKKKFVGLFVNLKSAMLAFIAVVIWLAFANINASVQSTPDEVLTVGNYLEQNAVVTGDTCANPIDLILFQPIVGIMTNDVGNDYELDTSASTSCYLGAGNFTSRGIGRDRVYRFVPPQTRAYSARMSLGNTTGNVILYFSQSCPTATAGTPVQLACQNTGGTAPTAFAAANRNDTPVTETEEISCQTLTAGTPY
ncbi:MAG: hypothetical protein H7Z37_02115, partial [Pyrinomonadaceae bacterium]|nr:hypothetical protein [Pyrinomonadaceae bacterium]